MNELIKMTDDESKEIWKDIIDYEGLYQISNLGRVKSLSRKIINSRRKGYIKERILKFALNSDGYKYICLHKNNKGYTHRIHKLVAIMFINNINNKSEVNHIDGNKQNNNVNNLEWCTRKENILHGYKNNLYKYKGHLKKYSEMRRIKVVQLSKNNKIINIFNNMLLASKILKINQGNISNCIHGKQKIAGGYKWEIYKKIN